MKQKTGRNMTGSILAGLLGIGFLTGCGASGREVAVIERLPYEKMSYRTAEVQRGDLTPEFTISLSAEGFEQIGYDMTNEDLQLDKVYVSVGDKVKKGDLLVSFQSDSIEQVITDYTEQKKQKELLIEHYTNLMAIDGSVDYSSDITMLKKDILVAELYIEEAEEKLADCQITAKEDGTITAINEYLRNGYYMPGKNLITEVSGTGNYMAVTREAGEFTVGEIYIATADVVDYELRLTSIKDQTLVFEPVSDMSAVSEAETLTMTVKKPQITDAVYVDADAVHQAEDRFFVYVLDEEGYRDAVWVTTGDEVDGYYVITGGLSGGEKVTLN